MTRADAAEDAVQASPSAENVQRVLHTLPRQMSGRQHFALEGLVIAIVTPFQPLSLSVDEESLVKYLEHLWRAGVKNIIVNGTTGEFSSMEMDERMRVTELVRANWPGVILNNVSATSCQDAQKLLEHSQKAMAGPQGEEARVEAALLLPPYYFAQCSEAGLERWLRQVLESARQPLFLYNFPAHTGNLVGPELYKRLARDFPLLRGIKNTFDDVPLAKQFKNELPSHQVYIGSDKVALEALREGLDGNVSSGGGSAVLPEVVAMVGATGRGDTRAADSAFAAVTFWLEEREKLGVLDIPAAKTALSAVIEGFSPVVRPPLQTASREQQEQLKDALQRLGSRNP